jgi:hypothetical protein
MRNAVAARHFTFRVPTQRTFPPLMSLSGHKPIHEANADALRNFVKPGPISPKQCLSDASPDSGDFRQVHAKDTLELVSEHAVVRLVLAFRVRRLATGRRLCWRLEIIQAAADLCIATINQRLVTPISFQRLPQCEQVLWSVIANEGFCDHLLAGFDPLMTKSGQRHGLPLAAQNGIEDCESGQSVMSLIT